MSCLCAFTCPHSFRSNICLLHSVQTHGPHTFFWANGPSTASYLSTFWTHRITERRKMGWKIWSHKQGHWQQGKIFIITNNKINNTSAVVYPFTKCYYSAYGDIHFAHYWAYAVHRNINPIKPKILRPLNYQNIAEKSVVHNLLHVFCLFSK